MDGTCQHDLVAVHWIDAEAHPGWSDHARVTPTVMITVGYEVDKDDTFIYMASTHQEGETWSELGLIPWGCVVKVEVISENFPCRGKHNAKANSPRWASFYDSRLCEVE